MCSHMASSNFLPLEVTSLRIPGSRSRPICRPMLPTRGRLQLFADPENPPSPLEALRAKLAELKDVEGVDGRLLDLMHQLVDLVESKLQVEAPAAPIVPEIPALPPLPAPLPEEPKAKSFLLRLIG